ncbi:Piso0_003923 [Millerozyma farinosa CBS 7064]|uniref:Piso0_003923 protein n=1 Tax=Pichia sorbitophila (strain ATCC MYA-4447 / BCRC 22081 / CBS 7064 / NBRC 10061 / NRRL Y-12695) TaxID=559304 RepID=G8Y6Z9_PICSO|nr:Piso0_003923 [Millerozyma farinosa CBS 7064]CCE84379.1 Piso0_003923 [Millerozyma farinosa CBS 7064]
MSSIENDSSTPSLSDRMSGKSKSGRRQIACKSCHALKVKCTPADENDPSGPCIRCLNSKRQCEIDLTQTRKRRKKRDIQNDSEATAHKDEEIAMLQEQVKMLQEQLSKQQEGHHAMPSINSVGSVGSDDNSYVAYVSKDELENELHILTELNSGKVTKLSETLKSTDEKKRHLAQTNSNIDIINAGLLTVDEAKDRLMLYRTKLFPIHRVVEVPADLSVEEMRSKKPYLFLAVMSITNAVFSTSLCTKHNVSVDNALLIDNFTMRAVTQEILVVGSKSIELIGAILLLCLWYNSPELFKYRRFHLLNSLAVALLHDLGIVGNPAENLDEHHSNTHHNNHSNNTINNNNNSNNNNNNNNNNNSISNNGQHINGTNDDNDDNEYRALDDTLTTLECSRLIMSLYSTTVSTCLILRRTIYVKWTPYVEECAKYLENHKNPNYREIAIFSRLNHRLEIIHHLIHSPDIAEKNASAMSYITVELQRHLNAIKQKIPENDSVFQSYYYSIEAYLNEPMTSNLFGKCEDKEGGPSLNESSLRSIIACTEACLRSIKEFNKLEPDTIASLPLTYASRIIYTSGMLLRLRYLILSLDSPIDKDLVPKSVVKELEKLCKLIEEASCHYPLNHFLKKTRLILQLFFSTYASQIHDLITNNEGTPENFKMSNYTRKELTELEKLTHLMKKEQRKGLITTESGVAYQSFVPWDIFAYAANVKKAGVEGFLNRPPNASSLYEQPASGQRVPKSLMNRLSQNYGLPSHESLPDTLPYKRRRASNTPFRNLPTEFAGPGVSNASSVTPHMQAPNLNNDLQPQFNNQQQQNGNFYNANAPNVEGGVSSVTQGSNQPENYYYWAFNDEFWSDLIDFDSEKFNFLDFNSSGPSKDEVLFMN